MSAATIAREVRGGQRSAVAVLDEAMGGVLRAEALNALLHVHVDEARAAAAAVDARVAAGEDPGPLAGVPVVIKDNLAHAGQPCGCASRILEGYVSPYTATAVARLEAAGAVVLGRSNMDEFAMGSSNENSAYGAVRSPWDAERVPGGSSGGSAVAVTVGAAPIALGSETGGSVRQPASLCGIVGLKPTYGRVSRYGLVAFGSSVDQVAPFGRTVADAALALQVMSGLDPADPTSSDRPVPELLSACDRPVSGLRVGIPVECWGDGIEPGVRAATEAAIAALEAQGVTVVPVSAPLLRQSIAIYQVLTAAEASSNLARFDGIRYGRRQRATDLAGIYTGSRAQGFGPEVQRRILLGTFVLSAGYADRYYARAVAAKVMLGEQLAAVLEGVDALATPTSPTVAFRLGARAQDPLAMYLSDIFTAPANLAGLPAISVPCGLSEGLPVGLQLMGRAFEEGVLLALASAVERAMGLVWAPGVR